MLTTVEDWHSHPSLKQVVCPNANCVLHHSKMQKDIFLMVLFFRPVLFIQHGCTKQTSVLEMRVGDVKSGDRLGVGELAKSGEHPVAV